MSEDEQLDFRDGSKRGTKSKWLSLRWIVALMILIGAVVTLGVPIVKMTLAAPYIVTAGEADFRPDMAWGVSPAPLQLHLKVHCNDSEKIVFSRFVVNAITDDQGMDLLGGSLNAVPFRAGALGNNGLWTTRRVSGGKVNWITPGEFRCSIDVPKLPSRDVRTVNLKGRIEIWNGGEERREEVVGLKLKKGERFTLGGATVTISNLSQPGEGATTGRCVLKVDDPLVFFTWLEITPEVEHGGSGYPLRRWRVPAWPEEPGEEHTMSFDTPPGVKQLDLKIAYRVNCRHVQLPFDLSYSVRELSIKNDLVMAGMRRGPSRERPSIADWGKEMAESEKHNVRVVVGDVTGWDGNEFSEMNVPLRIEVESDERVVATDLRIERLEDAAGHDFLQKSPWASDEYRPVWVDDNSFDRDLMLYAVNVWSRGPVKGSGICRIGFGRDETTETFPGAIDVTEANASAFYGKPSDQIGTEIVVGGVSLIPMRLGSDFLEFRTVGNIGIISQVSALDENGKVLATQKGKILPFYAREGRFYIDALSAPEKVRAWRVRYFRRCVWMEEPFDFDTEG